MSSRPRHSVREPERRSRTAQQRRWSLQQRQSPPPTSNKKHSAVAVPLPSAAPALPALLRPLELCPEQTPSWETCRDDRLPGRTKLRLAGRWALGFLPLRCIIPVSDQPRRHLADSSPLFRTRQPKWSRRHLVINVDSPLLLTKCEHHAVTRS